MNKSIVLVMCDILVLSAMSLSSGGFSEADELDVAKMKNIDFDVVSRDAFENLQQQLDEAKKTEADAKAAEKAARKAEALAKTQAKELVAQEVRAKQEAEAARASEAQAKAIAETARKNEILANVKAVEAQKREEEAKVAEKAARQAEALAKTQAEEASAQAETARKNESVANAKAAEAQKREEGAKAAEKAAREAEALAKTHAEEAAAKEARAKKEAETARANEAQARADAALARQNEAEAKGLAEKATFQRNLAEAKADKLQAELDEIHARQNALIGNIPQGTIWKMTIKLKAKKSDSKPIYSPLYSLDGEGFLFFELPPSIEAKVYSEVESVTAHYDKMSVTGGLYRLQGHDNWIFVKVGNLANKPHIGFGVESLGIDGNIVFYPEQGKFEGDPVKCECDGKGNFLCSSKTENRNGIQQFKGEHSVFERCLLVSTIHGAIGAIAREKTTWGGGMRRCEKLAPLSVKDLLPIGSGN